MILVYSDSNDLISDPAAVLAFQGCGSCTTPNQPAFSLLPVSCCYSKTRDQMGFLPGITSAVSGATANVNRRCPGHTPAIQASSRSVTGFRQTCSQYLTTKKGAIGMLLFSKP